MASSPSLPPVSHSAAMDAPPSLEGKAARTLVVRSASCPEPTNGQRTVSVSAADGSGRDTRGGDEMSASLSPTFSDLPNEVLLDILGFLDVNDLLSTSRASHHLRCLCMAPILHILRRRRIRAILPPLLFSPARPSLADLASRSIFLTNTTVVSRKLSRNLVSIRLSHRLAARPPVQVLVERAVIPPECAPGIGHLAPALVARTRAIERQRVKDGLSKWVGAVWKREVGRRSEYVRKRDERIGVGRVWRLRRFWERVSRGQI